MNKAYSNVKMKDKSLLKMLDYQKAYVMADHQILFVEKSRQIGFTFVSAYRVLRRIMKAEMVQNHYWLSRDEELAKLFIFDMMQWINAMNILVQIDVVEMKEVKTQRITFPCGSELYCLSSSYDAVIGRRGHFYLDEFAIHKQQKELLNYVLPATKLGGSLTVISTHRHKQTIFNQTVEKIRKGEIPNAALMTVTLDDALADGYMYIVNLRKMLAGRPPQTADEFVAECRGGASSPELYAQEYQCKPADADQVQAVKEDALTTCMVPRQSIAKANPEKGKSYYMGVDIGRHRDLTVITVLELIERNNQPFFIMRSMKTIPQSDFSKQEAMIYAEIKKWRPYRCHIDGTTVGAQIAETLSRRMSYCESIKITSTSRPVIIGGLINFIDKTFIELFDEQDLWADMMSVERYINKMGNIDFWIPSRGDKGHGDRFMSIALAVHAAMSKSNRIGRKLLEIGGQSTITTQSKKDSNRQLGAALKARKRRFRI